MVWYKRKVARHSSKGSVIERKYLLKSQETGPLPHQLNSNSSPFRLFRDVDRLRLFSGLETAERAA